MHRGHDLCKLLSLHPSHSPDIWYPLAQKVLYGTDTVRNTDTYSTTIFPTSITQHALWSATMNQQSYQPTHKIRIVTAASLFDGHDASINVMRRILQATGGEIIHLGHHRSVREIVDTAIQEDAQAIAVTSYQGGHMEYFKYMYDLLRERGSGQIKIFGGGGGTILPHEQQALHDYGIARIYSPDDGRAMGLQGMIDDLLRQADFPTGQLNDTWAPLVEASLGIQFDLPSRGPETLQVQTSIQDKAMALGQLISAIENEDTSAESILIATEAALQSATIPPVLGITGTGGAGKSSLVDELVRRFLLDFDDKSIAIVSVDPSKRRTGGGFIGRPHSYEFDLS